MSSSTSRQQFLIASSAALMLTAGTGARVTSVGAPGKGVQPQAVMALEALSPWARCEERR